MPRRPPRRSGGTGRRNLLAAVATSVAGIGLGLNVLEPEAYTSAVLGRGANVAVADDPNAVLGLEGLTDTSVTPTFTNRSSSTMDVTLDAVESGIEWDVGDDGTYATDPVTFTVASGSTTEVAVKGADEVTADIQAIRASNGTTTGRIELQRVIDVPQSNVVQEIQGSAKAAGNSGKYEFELENTGNVDVSLVAVGVNETTNPDATQVDGGGILLAAGQSVVSSEIPVDSSDPSGDTRVDFDQSVALNAGQTKSFEFDRFRDIDGKNAKMKGEDLRVTFYFTDGSAGVVELCLNGCSF
ncbi:hypothetical protein [Halorubellus salinus]|uniref:hypothetical protein n=1 Tax=Halorubellus salinus TaxID=755309 RepID=UPI001D086F3A|nr:hypothetical protein [Halorubellus salinus]